MPVQTRKPRRANRPRVSIRRPIGPAPYRLVMFRGEELLSAPVVIDPNRRRVTIDVAYPIQRCLRGILALADDGRAGIPLAELVRAVAHA